MSSFRLESASRREAKRIMRLLARRRSHWPDEPLLRQLTPQQIEALQDYIASREKERHRLALTALFFMLFALVSSACAEDFLTGLQVFAWEALFFIPFLVAARQYRYAVYALTQTNDVRVLPTLIQATRHQWARNPQVVDAILRLLEHVTEAHTGLLDNATQQRLWRMGVSRQILCENYDRQVVLHTLRTLAAVGNHTILTQMQRFILVYQHSPSKHIAVITARELIPVMEARLQRQQVPETLLRAADTPTAHPETLLRAAHPTTAEPSHQLLRASTGEEREP